MKTLTMSFAFERAKYGRLARSIPSRFLFESEGSALPPGWVGAEAMAAKETDAKPGGGGSKKKTARNPRLRR